MPTVTGAPKKSLAVTGAPKLSLAVTGATGFVGGHLVDHALAAGHRVQALTRRLGGAYFASGRAQPLWVEGTLETPDMLALLCEGADAVIHIAGAVNVPTRADFARANIAGTQAIVDAASAAGVRRFVHVSSLAAREPGLSNYGWSKAEAERIVRGSGLDWVIVRPPGVYGPRDADMLELFKMAKRGLMLLPPGGRGSWIHADDLARLLLTLVDADVAGAIYEPDDGTPVSHRELARLIAAAVGRPGALALSAPRPALTLAAHGDRLVRGKRARLTPDRARYMAHADWASTPALAVPDDIWRPHITLTDGLVETARWYRSHGQL